jgi:peptidyl-prolyl cis-trans isomerase SurA
MVAMRKPTGIPWTVLAAVSLPVVAVGAGGQPDASTSSSPLAGSPDTVAALVNGETITLSAVQSAQRGQSPRDTLERLIGGRLLEAEARALHLEVTEDEITAGVGDVQKANRMDDAQFEKLLTDQGFTLPAYRAFMRGHLLRSKVLNNWCFSQNASPPELELKTAYDSWAQTEGGVEVHARQIFVSVSPTATPKQVAAAQAKANALAAEAQKPAADFAEISRKRSEGPTASGGGDLGFFRRGVMLPEFDDAVFKLKPGEVSAPIRTARGFHIVKVEERRPVPLTPFADMKAEIVQHWPKKGATPTWSEMSSAAQRVVRELVDVVGKEHIAHLRQKANVDIRL